MPQSMPAAEPASSPLLEGIKAVLERVRPNLRNDGGDVELEGVSLGGEVTLRLTGCVARCPMAAIALIAGLECALRDAVAGVTGVKIVR
jgi:Fe-S cluster biogenesis protein NfuA